MSTLSKSVARHVHVAAASVRPSSAAPGIARAGRRRHFATEAATGSLAGLTDEQQAIQDLARQFSREEVVPRAAEYDRSMAASRLLFPWDIIKKGHEAGLMNLHVPEDCGGPGLGVFTSALVSEELGYGCTGVSTGTLVLFRSQPTVFEANGLASAPVIVAGSDEQKREYLGRLTAEPLIASYCVTEPSAGSDVANIATRAVKDGDKYILNGSKCWITGAGHANWFFVLAVTDASAKANKRLSGFIVDANTPGITIDSKLINMGQRCSDTRLLTFDNVAVPVKNLLGKEGDGFKIAMKAFDITRPLVASAAVGLAQRALSEAAWYAQERKTFGKPIIQHQAIGTMLAQMAVGVESSRALVWKAGLAKDGGDPRNTYYASLAKALASETAVSNANKAVQIFGGSGFNTEYPVEKLYRDAKIFELYEGTTQIQHIIISRQVEKDHAI
ncbi:hypothetical protein OIV83_006101 [Microbotryomycetes sp. JL201]|nr:hypothetical protein OIV83_006101 [Microbotryomycetes sp. JL201]